MPKPKTKRQKADFKTGLNSVLQSFGIDLDDHLKDQVIDSISEYIINSFKPDNKTMHWNQLVEHYFKFYEHDAKNGVEPAFMFQEPKALKEISNVLKSRYLKKNKDGIWDAPTAVIQHEAFYRNAMTLPFIAQNFSISFLYSNFDKIVSNLSANRNKQEEIDNRIINKT